MSNYPFKHIFLGGTIDSFHAGHKEYIDLAHALAERVTFSLHSAGFAQSRQHGKPYEVKPFGERYEAIVDYLDAQGWLERCEIWECQSEADVEKFISDERFDAMLVLKEDLEIRLRINEERKKKYAIVIKPRTVDASGEDVSSTKLRS